MCIFYLLSLKESVCLTERVQLIIFLCKSRTNITNRFKYLEQNYERNIYSRSYEMNFDRYYSFCLAGSEWNPSLGWKKTTISTFEADIKLISRIVLYTL